MSHYFSPFSYLFVPVLIVDSYLIVYC